MSRVTRIWLAVCVALLSAPSYATDGINIPAAAIPIIAVVALLWFLGPFIAAYIAHRKGRSIWLFLAISFFFSPLVGLAAAFLVSPIAKCSSCDSGIPADAAFCPRCGAQFQGV
jgi:hypothetical protein